MVVVDTPGIGGVNRGHTAAALGVLPQADLVLYVTDPLRPLRASELAFISDMARALDAATHPERLMFAVTRADIAPDPQAAVAELRRNLDGLPGFSPRCDVLAVSSWHRLLHLAHGDPEDLRLSGFGPLQQALRANLDRGWARRVALPALTDVDDVLQGLLTPVQTALGVLDAEDAQARLDHARAAQERGAEADALAAGAATWPHQLRSALTAATQSVQADADASLAQTWRDIRALYRQKASYRDDPQRVLDELANRLALLTGQLARQAEAAVSTAVEQIAGSSGLRVRSAAASRLPDLPVPGPAESGALPVVRRPDVVENLAAAFQSAVRGAAVGAEYGFQIGDLAWDHALGKAAPAGTALVIAEKGARAVARRAQAPSPGAVAGTVAGALVAGILAFAAQVRTVYGLAARDQIAALDSMFAPSEEHQRAILHAAVGDLFQAHADLAETDLIRRIEQRRSECEAALAQATAALELAPQASAALRQELMARRETLAGLARAVAGLREAATRTCLRDADHARAERPEATMPLLQRADAALAAVCAGLPPGLCGDQLRTALAAQRAALTAPCG